MVSEAPSEEASLSDVFYIYLLILHPRYFTNSVSFHGGFGIYLQKLNTFLFKFGGSSTPH